MQLYQDKLNSMRQNLKDKDSSFSQSQLSGNSNEAT